MEAIMRIESVSQINEMIGYEKLEHPLISLIETSKVKTIPVINQKVCMSLYSIALKSGHECRIRYGRQNYDFQEGTLVCLAPGQTIEPLSGSDNTKSDGWILIFHPELISRSALGKRMHEYTFFSYESHEALHLSDQERQTITGIARAIKAEYSQNMDVHSPDLIVSNLELLLNYCRRFYGRQFITRRNTYSDVVSRFEEFLITYFESDELKSQGLPTVRYCAQHMGYSPNYLSDLLKAETGKNAQDHIHFRLIEKAKVMLLGTQEPVNRIAYSLGFEYPQHFSKLFKHKTGMSPAEFRTN